MDRPYWVVRLPQSERLRNGYNAKLGRKTLTTHATSLDDAITNVIARHFKKRVGSIETHLRNNFGNPSKYALDLDDAREDLARLNSGEDLDEDCEVEGLIYIMKDKFCIKHEACAEVIWDYIKHRREHDLKR